MGSGLDLTRFWSKVEKTETCWLWRGSIASRGDYGCYSGRKAHRLAYAVAVAPIPPGLCVCHRCDVPHCVNPDHLFLGTHAENMADMKAKGRAVAPNAFKTHCKYGHPLTPENTYPVAARHRQCKECNSRNCRLQYLARKERRHA